MRYHTIFLLLLIGILSCQEDKIMTINPEESSLIFLKGKFNDLEYPDSMNFNAYFLGVNIENHEMYIPVRLSGQIDYERDRIYNVKIDSIISGAYVGAKKYRLKGNEYSFSNSQTLKKEMYQDTVEIIIHVNQLHDSIDMYRMRLRMDVNEEFVAGVDFYQYYDIYFLRNLNTPPNFWLNLSKLSKFTYHPKKCAVFLEISGITDPDWETSSNSNELDYWIEEATLWFLENETYDEYGNRIYFDQ